MALTEKDIGGFVMALVGAYRDQDNLDRNVTAIREGYKYPNPDGVKASQENRQVMEETACELVIGVLVDLNRCANALESIALSLIPKP